MKTTTRIISTIVLCAALFTSTTFACGEMTNGSRCLIDSPTTVTTISQTDKKTPFDLEIEIGAFFRDIFGKIFG